MKRYPRHGAPQGRRRTSKEIDAILREHRQSGLSLLAFAHEHQLCYATLLRWRRRQPKLSRPGASTCESGPAFVPIQIESGAWSSDYVVSWPAGRSLRIPPGFDPQALRRLLDVLEERA